jgi:hypothetical protein
MGIPFCRIESTVRVIRRAEICERRVTVRTPSSPGVFSKNAKTSLAVCGNKRAFTMLLSPKVANRASYQVVFDNQDTV